jgi:hypothetical protein
MGGARVIRVKLAIRAAFIATGRQSSYQRHGLPGPAASAAGVACN